MSRIALQNISVRNTLYKHLAMVTCAVIGNRETYCALGSYTLETAGREALV